MSALPSSSVHLSLQEKDILKSVLEYLESRGLHISQLSLERETGVINGDYSDDLLFLRQLIIDGQWDNALDFVDPIKNIDNFDFRSFRYNMTKYKLYELLCIKNEPGPLHDNDMAVEELVECLKDLEHICPSPEDYRQLCALLTLPKLSDHQDFKHWNPSSARIECFNKIRPLVSPFLPSSSSSSSPSSSHDRLVSLLAKGVFYESCVDYCQGQAIGDQRGMENGPVPSSFLSSRPTLSSTDLSLVSWLEIVGREQFAMPFQQKNLDFRLEALKKPKLDAKWTEQILATPIKPGGFPHSMVPPGKGGGLKFTDRIMSQSLNFLPSSMNTSVFPSVRVHPMSQSTAPSLAFSIAPSKANGNDSLMQQSALIDNLIETSLHTKSSRPGGRTVIPPQSVSPQVMAHSLMANGEVAMARRHLDEITRRSLPPSSQRQSSLPPVPELSTPVEDNPMTQSRLFQEFSTRQSRIPSSPFVPIQSSLPVHHPIPSQIPYTSPVMSVGQPHPATILQAPPGSLPLPMYEQIPQNEFSVMQYAAPAQSRAMSMVLDEGVVPSSSRPLSYPPSVTSGLPVQFVPICRYEDSQAIRAVAFHPTGRFFAIGTNSKQLIVCKYPDMKRHRGQSSPEVLLSRPKQHRGSVYCLGFNPTGELLATGSNDKSLRLMSFNAESCKIGAEMELTVHDGTVRDVIFLDDCSSPRPSILVSGGAGNCHLHLTDCTTGITFQSLKSHTAPILGLYTWSSGGGKQFVSCSQDKTIRFWDVRSPNATNVIAPSAKMSNGPVTSVSVDPSGQLLVSGHEDASVTLFDINGQRVLQTFRPHADEVRTVRFSNAAYYLLSASYDKRIVITDMRGDLLSPLMYLPVAEHSDKIIQCRWHPYDFSFLSTSADRSAVLWALPTPSYQ